MELRPGHTRIDLVRAITKTRDAFEARWALAPALAALEPSTAPWPPSAIVFVRRVRDPMPTRAGTRGWSAAATQAIEAIVRRARRPAVEIVSSDAEAVVFFDRAEMLACLARDDARGATERRWWHPHVHGRSVRGAVARCWDDEPEMVPAVMEALDAWGEVVRVLAKIEDAIAARATVAVAVAHAVPAGAFRAFVGAVARRRAVAAERVHASVGVTAEGALEEESVEACELVAALPTYLMDAETLTQAKAVFVALALGLRRNPNALRGLSLRPPLSPSKNAQTRPTEPAEAARPDPVSFTEDDTHKAVSAPDRTVAYEPLETSPNKAGFIDEIAKDTPAYHHPSDGAIVEAAPTSTGVWTPWESAPTWEPAVHRRRTALGGVFYLANVLLSLGLYGDFAHPLARSFPVALWDLLSLVARSMLDDVARDPVWETLALLAGGDPRDPSASLREVVRRSCDRLLVAAVATRVEDVVARRLPGVDRARVADLLLRQRGEVIVSATRVDVMLSLDALPVEVRVAGLDRDPGWIPSAGRSLRFHFEVAP